ncbi:hypothetical protein A2307_06515 [Candidatus Peregrinibacteria bacterium RIFOXYB2_FULL_33_20]|nr:MAG: hypothetical protein A2307_06515 [Candidatus Peregrinibacteria bacterium RIFOXYB2_FULL_33_20]
MFNSKVLTSGNDNVSCLQDFTYITHLDLGCGPDGERIAWLMRQGIVFCLGIDSDISAQNTDLLALERAIKKLNENNIYPFRRYQTPITYSVEQHLVQGDVAILLQQVPTAQLELVYADFFFCNLDKGILEEDFIYKQVARIIRKKGKLIITEENCQTDLFIDYMMSLGFRLVSQEHDFELVTRTLQIRAMFNNEDIFQYTFERC